MTQSNGTVTFINVFELDADKIDEFIEGWKDRGEFMRKQPGFLSFHLHRALTPDASYQLVNVAVWESVQALRAATGQPEFQASVREAAARFGAIAHPGVYATVVDTTAD